MYNYLNYKIKIINLINSFFKFMVAPLLFVWFPGLQTELGVTRTAHVLGITCLDGGGTGEHTLLTASFDVFVELGFFPIAYFFLSLFDFCYFY